MNTELKKAGAHIFYTKEYVYWFAANHWLYFI